MHGCYNLILSTNTELLKQGREPLYLVYPYDGLSISDAPLGYVDQGDKKKEEAFLKLRDFLMSETIQKEIQRYGRRTGYAGILPENQDVWRKEWGLTPDRSVPPHADSGCCGKRWACIKHNSAALRRPMCWTSGSIGHAAAS